MKYIISGINNIPSIKFIFGMLRSRSGRSKGSHNELVIFTLAVASTVMFLGRLSLRIYSPCIKAR
jgi:hypothetical protein